VNPGLSRRFKLEEAFNFEDFDDAELLQILEKKVLEQDLDATDGAKQVAIDRLSRMRNRPNFGNAGEVENIITEAKTRCLARRARIPSSQRPPDIIFEAEDIDPNHNRAATATVNIERLFEDIIGGESIVERLKNYLTIARNCRERELDFRQRIPTNFVFTGPPGEIRRFEMLNTDSPPFQEPGRRQSPVRWAKCFMTWGCWLLRKSSNARHQTLLENM